MNNDQWMHRTIGMSCQTCMWFVRKIKITDGSPCEIQEKPERVLGRCRKHAPTMCGFPAVFTEDWCGDHKLDENRV